MTGPMAFRWLLCLGYSGLVVWKIVYLWNTRGAPPLGIGILAIGLMLGTAVLVWVFLRPWQRWWPR